MATRSLPVEMLAQMSGKAVEMFDGSAQAVTRSAERLQVAAEQVGVELQTTFTQLAGKVQSLYTGA